MANLKIEDITNGLKGEDVTNALFDYVINAKQEAESFDYCLYIYQPDSDTWYDWWYSTYHESLVDIMKNQMILNKSLNRLIKNRRCLMKIAKWQDKSWMKYVPSNIKKID